MRAPLRSIVLSLLVLSMGVTLVVGVGVPGAAAAPSPAVTDDTTLFQPAEVGPNTTRQLQLEAVDASGTGTASVSVTQAMQAETGAVEATLDHYALRERLDAGTADQAALLRAAIDRNEARIERLRARETAAREQFRAGEIEADCYLSTVGAVNREAMAFERILEDYEELTASHPALQDRVAVQRTETVTFTGPLATEAGAAVVGGDRTAEIYVSTSQSGMALSAIRDGSYVREIMRTDARDDAVGGVDLDAAQDRISTLYPWAWEHKGDVSINTVGQDVFRFQLSHGHGELNSLLDTSSDNVYREIQTKSLTNLPVVPGPQTTVNNTTLQLSAVRAGAPLRIQVQNATGAPVTASVTVGEEAIGTTGETPVWLLSPAEPFNVTAETGAETLELAVQPT